ncbi:hypothetical protein DAPPUDRAFT_236661 [Daphnia pulex]|uniref:Uncharacterized protein n=1 Tax=Daphnia pulex TaxID=6669 RepID=E9G2T1_DAPPU|nr:hypothetical protein DAPPUDRAFT_236661 [Daphnia pulex]|eukprot:EFX86455.1 hypothetical protein DAPPUDRAFT_236661 [Daphnia pulex]
MSDQEDRPSSGHNASLSSINEGSPSAHLLPNPIITKRTRTQSMLELALDNPVEHVLKIVLFHLFSIDGEYVPRIGDEVSFRKLLVPPKLEKYQAVHVQITNFTPEVHQRWTSALTAEESHEGSRPNSPSSMNVDS